CGDALGRDRVSHRVEDVLGDIFEIDACIAHRGHDSRVLLSRSRRHEELLEKLGAPRKCFRHGLRTLEEKQTGLLARLSTGELGHCFDTARAGIFNHRASLRAVNNRWRGPKGTPPPCEDENTTRLRQTSEPTCQRAVPSSPSRRER